MKYFKKSLLKSVLTCFGVFASFESGYAGPNQTDTVSPIYPGSELPFTVQIETADFSLPFGLQSFVVGNVDGKWLLMAGRTNGLHTFNDNPDNFPPSKQNDSVIVVDSIAKKSYFRSLQDPESGLTPDQIESLSVTSPQFYQAKTSRDKRDVIYMTGGYGYRSAVQNFVTWPLLTEIDIEGMIRWVMHPESGKKASKYIRQLIDPFFAVTGGIMRQVGSRKNPTLLCLGQDFEGPYFFGQNAQRYTEQIRKFFIVDHKKELAVKLVDPDPFFQDSNFRRRDLNIPSVIRADESGRLKAGLVAFSGVFTEEGGIWTVPITISGKGKAKMRNPLFPDTFKQGMNNYACANMGLYSRRANEMYNVFFGGISYGFFSDGVFTVDEEFPFINQVTAVKSSNSGDFRQYLLNAEYPVILSDASNPGNPLLFGAGAQFIQAKKIRTYLRNVLKFDKIKEPTIAGYIVGGIESTLPNTNQGSDSAASPYIFKVIVTPQNLSESSS